MALPNISNNQLALINAGIGGLGGWFAGQADDRRNAQTGITNLASLLAQLQAQENSDRIQATQLDPLAQQRYRAQFAERGEVMRNQTPVEHSFDPATGFASMKGGRRMPEGGWSDQTLAFSSRESMANAEAEFYGAAGMPYDFAGKGYGASGKDAQALLAQRLANFVSPADAFTQGLNNPALQQMVGYQPQGKKTPWWKKALGAVSAAAPIATSFIPGVGPMLSMAIGAGSGALSSGLRGGNPMSGAMFGAGSAALGNYLARPSAAQPITNGIPTQNTNVGGMFGPRRMVGTRGW